MRDQQLDDRVRSPPVESMTGRKTPTRPTRLLSRSTRPKATVDFPDRPSGEAMYTLRDIGQGYPGDPGAPGGRSRDRWTAASSPLTSAGGRSASRRLCDPWPARVACCRRHARAAAPHPARIQDSPMTSRAVPPPREHPLVRRAVKAPPTRRLPSRPGRAPAGQSGHPAGDPRRGPHDLRRTRLRRDLDPADRLGGRGGRGAGAPLFRVEGEAVPVDRRGADRPAEGAGRNRSGWRRRPGRDG